MPPKPFARKFSKKFDQVKKITFILMLTSIFYVVITFLNNYFLVKEIKIEGLPKNQTIKGLGVYKNQNWLLLKEEKIAQKIKMENPYIKSVVIKKIIPNQLRAIVDLYKPLAVLKVSDGFLVLAEDGRILLKEKKDPKDLPVINYYQKLDYYTNVAGEWIRLEDLLISLKLLNFSLDLDLRIDMIDINGLDMIGFNVGEKKILFTTKRSVEIQEYELEKLIHQFKIEGKEFESLDLRFDKPVVIFK